MLACTAVAIPNTAPPTASAKSKRPPRLKRRSLCIDISFLACHDNRVAFYRRLGYELVEEAELPEEAREYAYRVADLPSRPDHVHRLLRRIG